MLSVRGLVMTCLLNRSSCFGGFISSLRLDEIAQTRVTAEQS